MGRSIMHKQVIIEKPALNLVGLSARTSNAAEQDPAHATVDIYIGIIS